MITFDELLPRLDAEISEFEAAVGVLREKENAAAALQAELTESQAVERAILSDRSTDAKLNAEKLHRQQCLSAVLKSRVQDSESLWLLAYEAGCTAKRTFTVGAETWKLAHPQAPRNPLDAPRPNLYDFSF